VLLFLLGRFRERAQCSDLYNTLVIEDTEKKIIIGTTTLLIERKFLRACGLVGDPLILFRCVYSGVVEILTSACL